jgi:hypothetical protein
MSWNRPRWPHVHHPRAALPISPAGMPRGSCPRAHCRVTASQQWE